MLVWGGRGCEIRDSSARQRSPGVAHTTNWNTCRDGGLYDPVTDTWAPLAASPEAPTPGHTFCMDGKPAAEMLRRAVRATASVPTETRFTTLRGVARHHDLNNNYSVCTPENCRNWVGSCRVQ